MFADQTVKANERAEVEEENEQDSSYDNCEFDYALLFVAFIASEIWHF